MFSKLTHTFQSPTYTIEKSNLRFGDVVNGEFIGIEYFDLGQINTDCFFNLLPKHAQKDFCLTLMRVNRDVPPHTDTGIKTVINFYFETDNCETRFYNFKDTAPRSFQIENQTDGYMFEEADLDFVSSFIAEPYDIYVLDVDKPHSVVPLGKIKQRLAFNLSTGTYSYDEVVSMLRETGNL